MLTILLNQREHYNGSDKLYLEHRRSLSQKPSRRLFNISSQLLPCNTNAFQDSVGTCTTCIINLQVFQLLSPSRTHLSERTLRPNGKGEYCILYCHPATPTHSPARSPTSPSTQRPPTQAPTHPHGTCHVDLAKLSIHMMFLISMCTRECDQYPCLLQYVRKCAKSCVPSRACVLVGVFLGTQRLICARAQT